MITEEFRKEALPRWKLATDKMIAELQAEGIDIKVVKQDKAVPAQRPSAGMLSFGINMMPPMGGKPRDTRK